MRDFEAMQKSKLGTIKRRSPNDAVTFKHNNGGGRVLFVKTGRVVDASKGQLNGFIDWIPAEDNFEDYDEKGRKHEDGSENQS